MNEELIEFKNGFYYFLVFGFIYLFIYFFAFFLFFVKVKKK